MLKNSSGYVLLASLFIVLVLTLLLSVTVMRSNAQFKGAVQKVDVTEAFYAAESGVDRSIFELRKNPNWSPGEDGQAPLNDVQINYVLNESLPEEEDVRLGFYSVTVKDGGLFNGLNTKEIRSVGLSENLRVTNIITARVLVENPARFLFSTLGNLRVGSGSSIDADIFASDVFFDVNEALGTPGMNISIDGTTYFKNSIETGPDGSEHPAVSLNTVVESSTILFTGVDLVRFKEIAIALLPTHEAIFSNGDLSVNLSDVTADNGGVAPKIIFAEGDISISGQFDSSMIVVAGINESTNAGGNIFITGAIKPDSLALGDTPQIGLLAKRDVIIPSGTVDPGADLDIEAFIMADGEGASEGVFVAEGEKNSLGTLDFVGAVSARGDGRTAGDLNAFVDRDYTYNPQLTANRSIPFSPFIVNLINWRDDTFAPDN